LIISGERLLSGSLAMIANDRLGREADYPQLAVQLKKTNSSKKHVQN
jgi:hypothetical protein